MSSAFLGAKNIFLKKCSKNSLVSKKIENIFITFKGGGLDSKVIKMTFFLKPSLTVVHDLSSCHNKLLSPEGLFCDFELETFLLVLRSSKKVNWKIVSFQQRRIVFTKKKAGICFPTEPSINQVHLSWFYILLSSQI